MRHTTTEHRNCNDHAVHMWRTEAVAHTYSVKNMFLEISQNSQENTCARVSILIKFIKIDTLAQVLSCEFCEISKNTFSYLFSKNNLRWLLLEGTLQRTNGHRILNSTDSARKKMNSIAHLQVGDGDFWRMSFGGEVQGFCIFRRDVTLHDKKEKWKEE